MAETRYVIEGNIIPADGWFNADLPLISRGHLKLGAEDRYIKTCYNLWKNNVCYFRGVVSQFSEQVTRAGSVPYYNFYTCAYWGISGKTLKGDRSLNSTTNMNGPYPTAPGLSELQIGYSQKTCYASTLSHTGSGSVSFYLKPVTYTLSATFSGETTSKTFSSSGTTGGEVSESDFNSAAPLHFGGESVEFRATPSNSNIRVKRWTVNGSKVAGVGTNTLSISMYSSDMNIVCEFEQYKFPVTVKSGSGTSIGKISKAITSTYYETGKSVGTFTATVVDTTNYKFQGWYKNYTDNATAAQCTTLVESSTSVTITAESKAVTYCAKFASKKTKITVGVSGNGTFDITIGSTTKTDQTRYEDSNVVEGATVKLVAKPKDNYAYFDHWLSPSGASGTQNTYNETLSTKLLARSSNDFVAYFKTKEREPVYFEIQNIGRVNYSYFHESGDATSTSTDGVTKNWSFYEDSDFTFEAVESNKLYRFDHYEYRTEDVWFTLSVSQKPNWIHTVEGNKIIANIPPNAEDSTRGLRAVFLKKNTYTIATPTIVGEHPINKNFASASGSGCSVSGLPTPDDYDLDGTPKWLEGTNISISATQGPKWQFAQLKVVMSESTITETDNQSISFKLTGNVSKIEAAFVARQYEVTPSVDEASKTVGTVTMIYKKITGEDEITNKTALVYVDTPVTIEAKANKADGSIAFHSWSLNNAVTDFSARQTVTIVGKSSFVATFKVKQTFTFEGTATENNTNYNLGELKVSYKEDGYVKELILPSESIKTEFLMLVCGSTYTLLATAKTATTSSGAKLQGYFNGWQQENNDSTWSTISGWGEEVEDVQVVAPRSLKAVFSKENRWLILRLRNVGDTAYASFSVGGARIERAQKVNEKETVILSNANDYFCDPYSVVQVRLNKYYEGSKFLKWVQYEFGTVDKPGTNLIGDYSTTQDLSVFMTGNLYLVPVFYTGNPIPAVALLGQDIDSTYGDVSIEGEALEETSDSRKSFAQGDSATFVASPRNGYRFIGWSTTGAVDAIESASARYEVVMDYAKTYYAFFEQDNNAIYRFGESEESKAMTWHSKRVVVNTPTDFSVAQVDAEGYGEEGPRLSVFKASSPDVPAKGKTYTIKDGNSRRLVMGGRGEKCFEFVVESAVPVNRVAISTSVTGLMGGA